LYAQECNKNLVGRVRLRAGCPELGSTTISEARIPDPKAATPAFAYVTASWCKL